MLSSADIEACVGFEKCLLLSEQLHLSSGQTILSAQDSLWRSRGLTLGLRRIIQSADMKYVPGIL